LVNLPLATINFLTPVNNFLPLVEERMRDQTSLHHPELKAAVSHLLASGGKRIRPAVALLTGGMLGAEIDRVVTLSAAIELLHTATLVHDDLIDGALLRRGIATLNAEWSPAATVLTGDYIFACAAKLAAATNSVPVMHLFAETLATIVSGEITQLFVNRGLVNRDEYYKRIYAKTASMFELATAAAAVLSPVSENTVELARSFGYEIGMAFQIVDDVLDFTGEQATVGKPVASDLRQGVITLPALIYRELYPDDGRMKSVIDGHGVNNASIEQLIEAIRNSGAIELSLEEANRFIDRGLSVIRFLPDSPEHQALEELACYIVDRNQ
jgi:geranylgeranyl pyrophosphate synthase